MKPKAYRRQRVLAANRARHDAYKEFVAKIGDKLTYAQWLHPQMRLPLIKEFNDRKMGQPHYGHASE